MKSDGGRGFDSDEDCFLCLVRSLKQTNNTNSTNTIYEGSSGILTSSIHPFLLLDHVKRYKDNEHEDYNQYGYHDGGNLAATHTTVVCFI